MSGTTRRTRRRLPIADPRRSRREPGRRPPRIPRSTDARARLGEASIRHLQRIRDVVEGLATEAGLADTEAFAKSWHILMKGSIISATEGDLEAARRAKEMAEDLMSRHRKTAA